MELADRERFPSVAWRLLVLIASSGTMDRPHWPRCNNQERGVGEVDSEALARGLMAESSWTGDQLGRLLGQAGLW